ncbi:MAG TPA: hypothetical protein VFR86_00625 [Burkholderiaceae bacterium]|nr:hypothetical protein [Burkholderiaceae bacterium]
MPLALIILQTLLLVAGLSLFGQAVVGIFNWRQRHENFVYQLFGIVSRPLVRMVRVITPRIVIDPHVPLVAFLLCVIGYFALGFWHRDVCLADLQQLGCAKWVEARSQ